MEKEKGQEVLSRAWRARFSPFWSQHHAAGRSMGSGAIQPGFRVLALALTRCVPRLVRVIFVTLWPHL